MIYKIPPAPPNANDKPLIFLVNFRGFFVSTRLVSQTVEFHPSTLLLLLLAHSFSLRDKDQSAVYHP